MAEEEIADALVDGHGLAADATNPLDRIDQQDHLARRIRLSFSNEKHCLGKEVVRLSRQLRHMTARCFLHAALEIRIALQGYLDVHAWQSSLRIP